MRLFYSERRELSLPENHRFPVEKYTMLLEAVESSNWLEEGNLQGSGPASDEQLLLVHTDDYLNRMETGAMSEREMRRIGFPWSCELVERSRRSVGASISAARSALEEGVAANLGGGTHHAFPDHGEGYCVFNDIAVAARVVQAEGLARKVLILDCDVHQGNGTAAIFALDSNVFTFSIHGEKNFPFHKQASDLDIPLPDGCGDEDYLKTLQTGLKNCFNQFTPDLVFYIAGADPYAGDRLGRLQLSKDGLAVRDEMVIKACREEDVALAAVMGGGYARRLEDTVTIHLETLRIANEYSRLYREREYP